MKPEYCYCLGDAEPASRRYLRHVLHVAGALKTEVRPEKGDGLQVAVCGCEYTSGCGRATGTTWGTVPS